MKSIREFVDNFHRLRKPLHVLCNNAGHTTGFQSTEMEKTEDGFEATFGVNYLGKITDTFVTYNVSISAGTFATDGGGIAQFPWGNSNLNGNPDYRNY